LRRRLQALCRIVPCDGWRLAGRISSKGIFSDRPNRVVGASVDNSDQEPIADWLWQEMSHVAEHCRSRREAGVAAKLDQCF
jgi:hypothetical protein